MKKRIITMTVAGALAVSVIGGTAVFATQKDVKTNLSSPTITVSKEFRNSELIFKFNEQKYELMKFQKKGGPAGSILMIKGKDKAAGINFRHIEGKAGDNAETRYKEMQEMTKEAELKGGIETTNLTKEAVKLNGISVIKITYGDSKGGDDRYFFDDKNGGTFELLVDSNSFDAKELNDMLNTIEIIEGKDVKTNSYINVSSVSTEAMKELKETKSLSLGFDDSKFELVQCEGESIVFLMDKNPNGLNSNVFISWEYLGEVAVEKATEAKVKEIQNFGGTATIEKSDLKIDSVKVVDKYEDDSSMSYYYISDNKGGTYKVFVNTMAFNAFYSGTEMMDILNSINVVDKEKNTLKIKIVEPFLG